MGLNRFIFGLICCLFHWGSSCRISTGWYGMTMEERLVLSENVFYGRTKQHVASTMTIKGKSMFFIDAIFEVYCVLSLSEDNIPEEITIAAVAPRDGCSGTKSHMAIDNEVIVGLKKREDGKYEYDEVMPTLSAAFSPSRANFLILSKICGMQEWHAPINATENRCPICGTNKFRKASLEADTNDILSPCIINGIDFSNGSDCDLLQGQTVDNTTVCVSTTNFQTCQQISVVDPGVTCNCTTDQGSNRNGGGQYVDVSGGDKHVSNLVHVLLAAAMTPIFAALTGKLK